MVEPNGGTLDVTAHPHFVPVSYTHLDVYKRQADELTVYIDELAEMAKYSDVKILITSEIKNLISVRQATLFYDFFYAVADWASERKCPYILTHLRSEKGTATMRLLPSGDAWSFKMEGNLDAAITSAVSYTHLDVYKRQPIRLP